MNPSPLLEQSLINLGSVENISPGQGRAYIVAGQEIAIFRQRDGRVFAVQNRCPHRQGPLSEGLMGNGKVICPLHAHRFDLKTGKGHEPTECLKTFSVSVVNDEILLNASAGNCVD